MWIEQIQHNMVFVWLGIFVLMVGIEAATMGITSIWFAIGALISCLIAWLGVGIPLQIAVFFVVSILLIIFTRPIAVKRLKIGREKNVTEQIEGRRGLVTESIKPFGSGLVKVDGVMWTAIGEYPEVMIQAGCRIQVVRIEGVKLIVKQI
jgi:membrane protein implicated in regulation of membrane protease activity